MIDLPSAAKALEKFRGPVVEICEPHPDNPSPNIIPVDREALRLALSQPPPPGREEIARAQALLVEAMHPSASQPSARARLFKLLLPKGAEASGLLPALLALHPARAEEWDAERLRMVRQVLRAFSDLAADPGLWKALTETEPSAHMALNLIDAIVDEDEPSPPKPEVEG